jgi:hypothetical protein
MKLTYIYVKESPRGMFYLGKTVREPFQYMGSGKKWLDHIKKYNFTHKDIKTKILHITENPDELKEVGLYYSKLFNVVEDKRWGNLTMEEGSGGATRTGQKHKKSTKRIMSEKATGRNHTEEAKRKISIARQGTTQTEESNKKRSEKLKGKKRPEEVVEKIRQGLLGKKLSPEHLESLKGKRTPYGEQPKSKCIYCGLEGGKNSITRWHNENCKSKYL